MTNKEKTIGSVHKVKPELSVLIAIDQIQDGCFQTEIKATKVQRTKLAQRFGLIEVKSFNATLEATFLPAEKNILVEGCFAAEVVQQCVVTLGLVYSDVGGMIHCKYSAITEVEDTGAIDFDLTTEEPPEQIVDGQFDVGIILAEHFGLELNPFPRILGVSFDASLDTINDNKSEKRISKPFDILKKLK